ncbi:MULTISPECIES: GntR family transcriptional regulator [Vagococcus]|uniref:Transcriptional regulator, GntR family n=1 Tax=Vagococcus fluvialis bH819 TaxID=1255619 RepID=A0A1X6WRC2_9ENTE|nr:MULTISPECIES: GntR family transcriptional regulator [Vagococcus]SLM86844.1 Transcriptional regulator, GntR family [Vagococcus fluvialis bH819]HCM88699.1 GntR family transcriptional regulator [Vagococcus sp.]
MLINELNSIPLYEQIVIYIKKQIKDGILTPGDRLLSVREMANSLKINPNTVNRAYKILEKEEFIIVLHGKGTFVKNISQTQPIDFKKKELKLQLELLLLGIHYQNISKEEAQNWINTFYSKIGTNL